MKKTISLSINVEKIEKERLYKGKKGTYLDAVLFYNSEKDQYDQNGFIVQSVSKEEREAGTKGNILGNAKELGGGSNEPPVDMDAVEDLDDDLPF